jgi:hypothetical protein
MGSKGLIYQNEGALPIDTSSSNDIITSNRESVFGRELVNGRRVR